MSAELRAQLEQLGEAERMAVLLWLADFATAETAAAVRMVRNAQADAAARFFCTPSPKDDEPGPPPPAGYVPDPAPDPGPLHPYM